MKQLTVTITGAKKAGKSNLAYFLQEVCSENGISAVLRDDATQLPESLERTSNWLRDNAAVSIVVENN